MSVLVTGAAGFVGFHVARALLARGERVLGVDRLDGVSCPPLAAARLARLEALEGFAFRRGDLAEAAALERAAAGMEIDRVVHLAGRAGLRGADGPSLVRDNVLAQARILAFCRERKVAHLVHASSSAVYGGPGPAPAPVSAYGATKRRAEILARAGAAAGGPPATSLRYFTLYGPWSRPDTAAWTFAEAILAGRPVRLHGHGRMRRSFTWIGDAAAATLAALDRPPPEDADGVRHAAVDVRHAAAFGLEEFVTMLETLLGRRALRERVPAVRGEVRTDAPVAGARPVPCHAAPTGIEDGLARFVAWYLGVGRAIAAEVSGGAARRPRPAARCCRAGGLDARRGLRGRIGGCMVGEHGTAVRAGDGEMAGGTAPRAAKTGKAARARVIWLTGLSGAGKSTIAARLERAMRASGVRTVVLDGDDLRRGLSRDLGFSEADRAENVRRAAEVAKLAAEAGLVAIVALISPFRAERRMARALMAPGAFVEVFVDTPLAVCEARDPKGLYRRARAGEIADFTGIGSPYEPPESPEIVLDGAGEGPDTLARRVIDWLEAGPDG